jgi:tetratricopeptide (TPR) repeat protein/O-antigen ligase
MSLALFLTVIAAKNTNRLFALQISILVSFAVVFLYHAVRLFVGPEFLSFGIFDQVTSTFLGRWHELSIFGGLVLMFLISSLEYLTLRPLVRWFALLGSLLTLAIMAVSGFNALWFIIAFIMLCIVVSKYISMKSFAPYALGVFIIAGVFAFFPTSTTSPVMKHFGITENEVSLPWQTTVDIAAGVIKSAPLLGSGPNQFTTAYNMFKPAYMNNTQAWSVDFISGVGLVPTLALTTGVLGIIAWIFFIVILLKKSLIVLISKAKKTPSHYLVISLLIGSVFMWLIAIVYSPTYSLWLITFVVTGMFVSAISLKGSETGEISPVGEHILSVKFEGSSKKKIVAAILVAVFGTAFILWGVLYMRSTIAQVYFQSGVGEKTSIKTAQEKFIKAMNWHYTDLYSRSLSTAYAIDFQNFLNEKLSGGQMLSATDTEMVSPTIKAAVDAADRAITLNPTNYVNYLEKAKILGVLALTKVDKAHETAIDLYQKVVTLSPNNPIVFYQAGLLEMNLGNKELALKFFGAAIQMKADYTDAIAMLGSVLYESKSYENALAAFNRVIELNPNYQNIHYFKALSLVGLERITDAIAELELAAKANPTETIISKYLNELKMQRTLPAKTADLPLSSEKATSTSATSSKKK